ncbi:unnamed protein product [Spodoptera littoralis]|uniref:Uncharacterized protein n=1 Tax=Spodoptera littoralis TaxID=7109 RepID=A0A9P0IKG3_SPOLI|nr:unnamed protein product [Spodoptera littoralis]CAH1647739.1 unnamed protein product [Spodoptera littoralis]
MNNLPVFYNYPTTFVTMQINTHHPAIANWSTKEKYELMKALRPNDLDIHRLLEKIPTKTRAEIEAAIKFYVSIAKHHPMLAPPPPPPPPKQEKNDKKRKAEALNDSPPDTLRELEEELNEIMPTNELVMETTTAIRMISEYNKPPSMEPANSFDSNDVYKEIANVMQSHSGSHTAEGTLNENSQDTAGRADGLDSNMTQILKNIKVPKRTCTSTASATTTTFGLASGSGSTYDMTSLPSTSAMASTSAAMHPARIRRSVATQHNPMNVSNEHLTTPSGSFDYNKDL